MSFSQNSITKGFALSRSARICPYLEKQQLIGCAYARNRAISINKIPHDLKALVRQYFSVEFDKDFIRSIYHSHLIEDIFFAMMIDLDLEPVFPSSLVPNSDPEVLREILNGPDQTVIQSIVVYRTELKGVPITWLKIILLSKNVFSVLPGDIFCQPRAFKLAAVRSENQKEAALNGIRYGRSVSKHRYAMKTSITSRISQMIAMPFFKSHLIVMERESQFSFLFCSHELSLLREGLYDRTDRNASEVICKNPINDSSSKHRATDAS